SNAIQQSDKNVTSNAVNKNTIGTEKTTSSQNDNVKEVMATAQLTFWIGNKIKRRVANLNCNSFL
ncbi:MAG: hypothetical protein ABF539_11985, partial [Liquorilactobacillus nagelii]